MKGRHIQNPKPFTTRSLEKGRVSVIQDNGKFFVSKKTTIKETRNLIRAQKWLKIKGRLLGVRTGLNFNITVPTVIEWENFESTLIMEYCDGNDLESELMRSDDNRVFYIDIISDLLNWVRDNGFYWQGFAPRNILINKKDLKIIFIDFESNLKIGQGGMTEKEFNLFIQDKIILELATLLFTNEQKYLFPHIWEYFKRTSIPLDNIDGRRRRQYVLAHYPNVANLSHKELIQIERKIVSIASPFYCGKKIFYPLIALSKIVSIDKYIETVSILERTGKRHWPDIIKKASENNG